MQRSLGTPMCSRRVRLERLEPRHLTDLHRMASADDVRQGWPLLGQEMGVAELGSYLWQLGRVHYAVVRRDSGAVVGIVQGIDEDPRSRTIGVAVLIDPRLWRAGWPLEGALLFVHHLLYGWGFRKLYFTVPASVAGRSGGGGSAGRWEPECVYRQHVRLGEGDAYDDVYVLSMDRSRWDTSLVDRLTGGV